MIPHISWRTSIVMVAALGTFGLGAGLGAQSGGATVKPDLYAGLKWRNIGPFHGGRIAARHRRHRPARRVLRRHAGRRHLENHQRRRDVVPDLRPVHGRRQHRRDSGRALGSQRRLRGHRRLRCRARTATACTSRPTPARRGRTSASRRRRRSTRSSIDPKDPNLVVASTQGDARHTGQGIYRTTDGGKTWENALTPERERHARSRVRVRHAEPDVRDERRARAAGGGRRRPRRRRRGAARPERHGALQVHRRGQDVDEGHDAAAVHGPHQRRGRDAHQRPAHLRRRRRAAGRLGPVSLRRSGRDVAAHGRQRHAHRQRPGRLQLRRVGGLAESRHPLHGQHGASIDRPTAARRSPPSRARPAARTPHDMWIDPTNGQRMLFGVDQGPARHARRRQDVERLLPDADRAGLPHRHRHAVSVLGAGVAAGHRRDHDAQPQRSGPDHGRSTGCRCRRRSSARSTPDPLHPDDRLRRRLRRGPGRRADQDRSGDRPVGQRRAELRRRREPVHGRPRFLEAVRHGVRSESDVRRLQLHPRDARRRADVEGVQSGSHDAEGPAARCRAARPRRRRRVRGGADAARRGGACAAPARGAGHRGGDAGRAGAGAPAAAAADVAAAADRSPTSRSRPSRRASSGRAAATARSTTRWTAARRGTTSRTSPTCRPNANFVHGRGRPHRHQHGVRRRERRRRTRRWRLAAAAAPSTRAALHLSHARRRQDVDAHRQRTAERRAHAAARCTSSARIRSRRACSSPAPRRRCSCRSTTAITGSRCG